MNRKYLKKLGDNPSQTNLQLQWENVMGKGNNSQKNDKRKQEAKENIELKTCWQK